MDLTGNLLFLSFRCSSIKAGPAILQEAPISASRVKEHIEELSAELILIGLLGQISFLHKSSKICLLEIPNELGMVVQVCNPRLREAETEGSPRV